MVEETSNDKVNLIRKLPRSVRKANLIYKWVMGILSGLNVALLALNNSDSITIPSLYFEIISVAATSFPILWSKLLDSLKEYEQELTPTPSVASPTVSPAASVESSVSVDSVDSADSVKTV